MFTKEGFTLRAAGIIVYMGLLFCLTCTENLQTLLNNHMLIFKLDTEPDFGSFFNFTDYPFQSPAYIQQKLSHALCFFWLAFTYKWVFRKLSTVFFYSVCFAFFTEVAQLFFSRTGCLLDVAYDTVGVIVFIALMVVGGVTNSKKSLKSCT